MGLSAKATILDVSMMETQVELEFEKGVTEDDRSCSMHIRIHEYIYMAGPAALIQGPCGSGPMRGCIGTAWERLRRRGDGKCCCRATRGTLYLPSYPYNVHIEPHMYNTYLCTSDM